MKSSNLPFLLVVLLGLGGYLGYTIYTAQIACVKPITYALADVDERFGISRQEVETDLALAAKIWNEAVGREVLRVGEEAELPVTFVYTKTQKTVDTLSSLEEDIDAAKEELRAIANQYGALKKRYEELNARGQASKEMYDELQVLFYKYETLRKEINADISRGQALPTGEIEEGKYIRDQDGTRILIYAYQDKTELKRTLIHEFGHALGLDHVENEDSIMYPSNNDSQSIELSEEDKAELARACTEAENSTLGKLYTWTAPLMEPIAPLIDQVFALAK